MQRFFIALVAALAAWVAPTSARAASPEVIEAAKRLISTT